MLMLLDRKTNHKGHKVLKGKSVEMLFALHVSKLSDLRVLGVEL